MKNATRTARIALVAVLGLALFLSVAALAAAGKGKPGQPGKPGKTGKSPSAAQYGPSGKQYGKTKVTICHKGKTITVGAPAVKAHLRHGDHVGHC